MPRHPFTPIKGRIETVVIDSEHLAGNLLGDPSRRQCYIYLPPEYDSTGQPHPLMIYLGAYTGSAPKKLAWKAFGENMPQRLERLSKEGKMGPVVMAFPDSFTSLGGNQFVDSPVMGNWAGYLLEELVPVLQRQFQIGQDARKRAVLGFSSGGYGALFQALRHGDQWGAIAAHSPDIGFELAFRSDLAVLLTRLARREGDLETFLDDFRQASKINGSDLHCLMLLGLAGSYDPDPTRPLGLRLPVDPETCELVPERWENWIRYDPLEMIEDPSCQASLKELQALFLDCGTFDQYHLQYGLRRFARRLRELDIPHHHEEFRGSHSGVDYRLDESLPYLFRSVAD